MSTWAERIYQRVVTELPQGRAATWPEHAVRMMDTLAGCPVGDHLEIGVLHGATAIMAALTKMELGVPGDVIGIDPLDGYYPASEAHPLGVLSPRGALLTAKLDPVTKVPITTEVVLENLRHFGVEGRVRIVRAFSHPWPEELRYSRFTSAYIDGDHGGDGPLRDWENVCVRIEVGGYVWFDNCDKDFPDVQRACWIAENTLGWEKVSHWSNLFIVRRAF